MDPDQYIEELAYLRIKEDREHRAQQRKELAAFIRKIVREEIEQYKALTDGKLYRKTK